MSAEPDVLKWQEAQRVAKVLRRRALLTKLIPVLIVVAVLGSISGALHWNDVRRRREVEAQIERDKKIPVPQDKIDRAKDILQKALDAARAKEAIRARAVASAFAMLEPSPQSEPCAASLRARSRSDLFELTAFSYPDGQSPNWSSTRTRHLEDALARVDRQVKERIGSGATLGDSLVAEANRLATMDPTVDFQFVVTRKVEPTSGANHTFSGGLLEGLLLAYDYGKGAVVCGAQLSGTSSGSVEVMTAHPIFGADDLQNTLGADVLKNAFHGAAEKLRVMVPRSR